MTTDERQLAENLYEEIGGDLCLCQRADVSHWCETCQQRIALIVTAFRRLTSPAAAAPTAHTLTLEFSRFLSEAEWREVTETVRQHVPHVKHLHAKAL